ncbi:MAG TPA: SEC-C metal-binding domain-containing protein [Gemmatales bacterium]|nr:SEC-C metal-binding domain-containing protein [Gemmatales bacterium]
MESTARHDSAQSALQAPPPEATEPRGNTGDSVKKVDPIRNKGPKVGRNDPCPCGSGKKHKICCMKK